MPWWQQIGLALFLIICAAYVIFIFTDMARTSCGKETWIPDLFGEKPGDDASALAAATIAVASAPAVPAASAIVAAATTTASPPADAKSSAKEQESLDDEDYYYGPF